MPWIRGKLDNRRAIVDVGLQPTLIAAEAVSPLTNAAPFNINPLRGLIDTGAQITCVTRNAAQAVGLRPKGKRMLGNVHNIEPHTAYSFVLGVWYEVDNGDPQNTTRGYYGFDAVLGCDFKDNSDFDVLIGMDIISQGDFSSKRNGEFEWFLP